MELTLNLGWVLVALAMMGAWLRIERTTKERRAQFIALAVVILILLPAISMTDDLMAAQNPAEIDCCVRRDDCSLHAHSSTPLLAALPLPVFKGLSFGIVQLPPLSRRSVPHVENPSLASIENRPPPVA